MYFEICKVHFYFIPSNNFFKIVLSLVFFNCTNPGAVITNSILSLGNYCSWCEQDSIIECVFFNAVKTACVSHADTCANAV